MPAKYTREKAISVFWSKVRKLPGKDACWEWLAGCYSSGYGSATYEGKQDRAHRIAWQLANGEIPAGMDVLHKCDNVKCVRASHLFLGTQADNNLDKYLKGRCYNGPPGIHRGELNSNAKITDAQAAEIRRRGKLERYAPLALVFGLSCNYVSKIVRGVNHA